MVLGRPGTRTLISEGGEKNIRARSKPVHGLPQIARGQQLVGRSRNALVVCLYGRAEPVLLFSVRLHPTKDRSTDRSDPRAPQRVALSRITNDRRILDHDSSTTLSFHYRRTPSARSKPRCDKRVRSIHVGKPKTPSFVTYRKGGLIMGSPKLLKPDDRSGTSCRRNPRKGSWMLILAHRFGREMIRIRRDGAHTPLFTSRRNVCSCTHRRPAFTWSRL